MANIIGDKISRLGGNIKQKTQSIAEVASLNAQIASENRQIEQLFTELGKRYFEGHAAEAGEDLADLCGQIAALRASMEESRQRIIVLKGIKTCPGCGAEVDIDAVFCSSCGTPLPKTEPEPSAAHCPQCGVELADGARFCVACGAKIGE